MDTMFDVIVIGGGVVGLSIARHLRADAARSVLLLDRGRVGDGASWAAAGLLSPQSEADEPSPLFKLGMTSLRQYRSFVEDLVGECGVDVELGADGLICLASTADGLSSIKRRHAWQREAKLNAEMWSPDEVRRQEPQITLPIVGALYFPDDLHIAPRRLLQALHQSCVERGVEIRSGVLVNAVMKQHVVTGNESIAARCIVVAAGVWSAGITGIDPPIPLRPRKGQILSLRMPGRPFHRPIRWQHAYFVPRASGELVVGATDEDVGFDGTLTPAGIGELLMGAQRISDHVASYPIQDMWTGLRPATVDGVPVIGPSSVPDVYLATGHYRNGILLAPITASIVGALVDGRNPPFEITPFSPARFLAARS